MSYINEMSILPARLNQDLSLSYDREEKQKEEKPLNEYIDRREHKDRTVPIISLLAMILMALLGFVAQNFYWKGGVDRDIANQAAENQKLWLKVETQELRIQRLRENMVAAGINPDTGQPINPPSKK